MIHPNWHQVTFKLIEQYPTSSRLFSGIFIYHFIWRNLASMVVTFIPVDRFGLDIYKMKLNLTDVEHNFLYWTLTKFSVRFRKISLEGFRFICSPIQTKLQQQHWQIWCHVRHFFKESLRSSSQIICETKLLEDRIIMVFQLFFFLPLSLCVFYDFQSLSMIEKKVYQ